MQAAKFECRVRIRLQILEPGQMNSGKNPSEETGQRICKADLLNADLWSV
jgi:hypothetical protein